ncbi:MAG TPA: CU044_2847 family protein [Mucilaginibacter sp.]|jgi:hypothetical protein
MSNQLVQYTLADGSDLFVEINEGVANMQTRGGDERGIIQNTKDSFDKALQPLKEISGSIVNCIGNIANSPQEIEVEMSLKFSAKAGIILTSLDSEAHLRVSLKWTKKDKVSQ